MTSYTAMQTWACSSQLYVNSEARATPPDFHVVAASGHHVRSMKVFLQPKCSMRQRHNKHLRVCCHIKGAGRIVH